MCVGGSGQPPKSSKLKMIKLKARRTEVGKDSLKSNMWEVFCTLRKEKENWSLLDNFTIPGSPNLEIHPPKASIILDVVVHFEVAS